MDPVTVDSLTHRCRRTPPHSLPYPHHPEVRGAVLTQFLQRNQKQLGVIVIALSHSEPGRGCGRMQIASTKLRRPSGAWGVSPYLQIHISAVFCNRTPVDTGTCLYYTIFIQDFVICFFCVQTARPNSDGFWGSTVLLQLCIMFLKMRKTDHDQKIYQRNL